MRKIRMMAPLAALMALALLAPVGGHAAAGPVGASDATSTTIEPILVKADFQVNDPTFRTSGPTDPGNITAFTMSTTGSRIVFEVTTRGNILRCPPNPGPYDLTNKPYPREPVPGGDPGICLFDGTQGAFGRPQNVRPYAGTHVLVLFQVPNMATITPVGCANLPCTGDAFWTPLNPLDGFYLAAYYGVSESGNREDVSLAVYDPSGRFVAPFVLNRVLGGGVSTAPLEPGAGQVFGVQGQHWSPCLNASDVGGFPNAGNTLGRYHGNNTSYSFPAANRIRFEIPYLYKWRGSSTGTNACAERTKTILSNGQTIKNAVAFSWMDHEVGTPETGLLIGWTWYLDSVPRVGSSTGYKVGTPSGDPNSGKFAGPNCPFMLPSIDNPAGGPALFAGGQVNPLWNAATPCMIPNPVGPGFGASGINLVAG